MSRLFAPALAYFAPVFAAAFVLGALRVTMIAPGVGAFAAVAIEVPVVLGFSWVVAGRVLRRWPAGRAERIAIGALALGMLMVAELALSVLVFGQTPESFFTAMATLPGALGLAGQIAFAAVPVLRG